MFLNKIETPCLVEFFKSRFADTGKNINNEASHLIVELVDNHPYYAQQLAQLSWLRTKDICNVDVVREGYCKINCVTHYSSVEKSSFKECQVSCGLTTFPNGCKITII